MTDGHLAGLLAAWLPTQRWFAGSGATVSEVTVTSRVRLADGDPELEHVLADVRVGQATAHYQILAGLRAELPEALRPATIGTSEDGRIVYDALRDPELASVLLRGIAERRAVGPLRFDAEPEALIDPSAHGRVLSAEQSNTSIVFGDRAILKVLRRPFQGQHPDLEVPMALARNGSTLVAPPLGWIVSDGPDPTVLAILSTFFAGARDGWSVALESLDTRSDFAGHARLLGAATGTLHQELGEAFGGSELDPGELARGMSAELADAEREVPVLQDYAPAIGACYAELADQGTPVRAHRIHGDYHLGQVLGTDDGWVVLDFEGEPSVPLAQRRAHGSGLRDVAGMLRSFDYAARHRQLGGADGPGVAWAKACQDAFCAGYAVVTGRDPRERGPLLRALLYQKAIYEAVYEARHRPTWLPIPLAAISEAG